VRHDVGYKAKRKIEATEMRNFRPLAGYKIRGGGDKCRHVI
jgi:hypothetical protein